MASRVALRSASGCFSKAAGVRTSPCFIGASV